MNTSTLHMGGFGGVALQVDLRRHHEVTAEGGGWREGHAQTAAGGLARGARCRPNLSPVTRRWPFPPAERCAALRQQRDLTGFTPQGRCQFSSVAGNILISISNHVSNLMATVVSS